MNGGMISLFGLDLSTSVTLSPFCVNRPSPPVPIQQCAIYIITTAICLPSV